MCVVKLSIAYLCCVSSKLLPPAYVVRGNVIFILGNVCLFTIVGGTLFQVWGDPISGLVVDVYPIPCLAGGYPIPGLVGGYTFQVLIGGVPIQCMGGTPCHFLVRGYPISGLVKGVTDSRSDWGVPHLRWGVPHLRFGIVAPKPNRCGLWGCTRVPPKAQMGLPPFSQTWDGVPPNTLDGVTPYQDLRWGNPLPTPGIGYPLYLRLVTPHPPLHTGG